MPTRLVLRAPEYTCCWLYNTEWCSGWCSITNTPFIVARQDSVCSDHKIPYRNDGNRSTLLGPRKDKKTSKQSSIQLVVIIASTTRGSSGNRSTLLGSRNEIKRRNKVVNSTSSDYYRIDYTRQLGPLRGKGSCPKCAARKWAARVQHDDIHT